MLARSTDPIERIVLLQHAIDNITGTFYTQVLFADYELRAHRLAEQDQPITCRDPDRNLHAAAQGLLWRRRRSESAHWADVGTDPALLQLAGTTSIRYATCFASAARIAQEIMSGGKAAADARERYLTLLRSGGNDYPMEQLRKAGVDLSQPDTVRAVVDQLDSLVTRLERELESAK